MRAGYLSMKSLILRSIDVSPLDLSFVPVLGPVNVLHPVAQVSFGVFTSPATTFAYALHLCLFFASNRVRTCLNKVVIVWKCLCIDRGLNSR